MLTRLTIQDVVLIEKLAIDFEAGLNAFTGETGAGKSILLDSMNLALGARSDVALIRHGADQASITAEFSLPLPMALTSLCNEQGLRLDESLILRRLISKDGKSRAFLNDQSISIGLLKQIGETLLEIHGQFETHGLLNTATHKTLLDAFAGNTSARQQTAETHEKWRKTETLYEETLALKKQAEAEEEFLRAAVAELDDLAPEPREVEKLAERRGQLQHREKIVEALGHVENAFSGDRGIASGLSNAGKALARIVDKAPHLADLLSAIDRLSNEAEEVTQAVTKQLYDIEGGTETLQKIEDRFFSLRAIARKHGIPPEELSELRQKLSDKLSLLTDQGDKLAALAKETVAAKRDYQKKAEDLSQKRQKAAIKLSEQVMGELPPLKLEQAKFIVSVEPLPENMWGPDGMDRVTFLAATNPGTPPSSLQKIASGGELARFMLAIKVILATADPVPVLVFDEVDTGIGGATASAVGERLAQLAKDVQVLVVTHSPQVAARGNTHLRVEKQIKNKQALTHVIKLAFPDRIEEIARMLSGSQTTDVARQAAKSLLNDTPPAKVKSITKAKRT